MLVPDIPQSLEITIKREAYRAKQALSEHTLMEAGESSGEEEGGDKQAVWSVSHAGVKKFFFDASDRCCPSFPTSIVPWLKKYIDSSHHLLTLSLPRVINFKFLLQPHQKYYTTQYKGFSILGFS